mgnify:FL=1
MPQPDGSGGVPEGENQIMRKIPRKYLFIILGAVLVAVLAALWQFYGSPTRVAFVNYPEYILAPMLDQPINSSVEVVPLKWTEKNGEELKN